MPTEIEPAELARLVDFAERPRLDDWSLRSALVRYAQPQPRRVEDLLAVVRRTDWALGRHGALLAREGPELWAAVDDGETGSGDVAEAIELLHLARVLDELGDVLAAWAADRSRDRPDGDVDRVTSRVAARLDELGVPRQERPAGPRNRG